MLDEPFLQRVQLCARGQPLDGQQLGAVGLDREDGTGLHRLAVEIDRTGAAVAGLASDMGAGHVELLAQEMDQQGTGLDFGLDRLAVDGQRYFV
jgi:hypothetical protein